MLPTTAVVSQAGAWTGLQFQGHGDMQWFDSTSAAQFMHALREPEPARGSQKHSTWQARLSKHESPNMSGSRGHWPSQLGPTAPRIRRSAVSAR